MIFLPIFFLIVYSIHLSISLKCYECTGYVPCGNGQTNLMINCPGKCMVYQNQFDGGMIIRRCCWNSCGEDGLSIYEGRLTYFCSEDICNGDTSDQYLNQRTTEQIEGSGDELQTTKSSSISITITTTMRTTTINLLTIISSSSSSSLLSCHECTGHYSSCGISEYTIIHNCRMCMVYRNAFDGNTIVRRCCYSGCGTPNSVSEYEGRKTYFCSSNLCNGIGSENALT